MQFKLGVSFLFSSLTYPAGRQFLKRCSASLGIAVHYHSNSCVKLKARCNWPPTRVLDLTRLFPFIHRILFPLQLVSLYPSAPGRNTPRLFQPRLLLLARSFRLGPAVSPGDDNLCSRASCRAWHPAGLGEGRGVRSDFPSNEGRTTLLQRWLLPL